MHPVALLTTKQPFAIASQGRKMERGNAEGIGRVSWGLVPEIRAGFAGLESWYLARKWEASLLCALVNQIKKRTFSTEATHRFWASLTQRVLKMDKEPLNLLQSSRKVCDFKNYITPQVNFQYLKPPRFMPPGTLKAM